MLRQLTSSIHRSDSLLPVGVQWVLAMPVCACGQFNLSVDETHCQPTHRLPSLTSMSKTVQLLWCSGASTVTRWTGGAGALCQGPARECWGGEMANREHAGPEDGPGPCLAEVSHQRWEPSVARPCAVSGRVINRSSHINRSGFSDNQSAAAGGAQINRAFYL